ncbi:hypothetical protein DNF23_45640 [Pseudomonas syringae pv. pisi]|jgi:hypothetical protein
MQNFELIVDFNGIVIFDPSVLAGYFCEINLGDNLYARFVGSDEGERVVEQGIVLPVLGLDDGICSIILRTDKEPRGIDPKTIIVSNATFPLKIVTKAVISDMATLREWAPGENWREVMLRPGNYAVTVNGFRVIARREIIDFGFEFVFEETAELPTLSGALEKNMQVLELPG